MNHALSTLTVGSEEWRGALVGLLPVRDGEEPWTRAEVDEVTVDLTADRERLTAELLAAGAELSDLLRNSGDGAGDDQADSGSSALEREHELTLVNNTRDLLEQTSHALDRLAAGTFGVCESCGQAIGKARLQAFPRAMLCVTCKQREERR
ncbi:TraR/DksA family transcriptional regulator [Cellulomonas wangsupingiae]|uniref:TraR/DksA family transcriptional regulator n=1 Tax=Cellulomonas wangsupingiae TaxID=2968085 RepID=A0ABY5KC12_9CELL|nr:TraR/DksA family transcriptional regulator [Cellulomonas wangsupingiae]MCC2335186.1 TraR/DksA family transcriptional regulator [Cellulomonas wangsupingiae]MCM0639194.1 TraR/DksA family transcriptional regulator [Cellulomonas wangsupingiae]UUI66667.1 TraR/DksA family transcriptional regulator [Cellulomonas wangsupingiae]